VTCEARRWTIRLLLLAALLAGWACGSDSGDGTPATTPAGPTAPLPALADMLADKALGSAAAPITMIEYSSLTCPHCATFHAATLPSIASAYIETGRVRFIYRDYPLDNTAVSAAMVARCSGDRYFAVLDLLYRSQATWAQAGNLAVALAQAVASSGMTTAEVTTCLGSTELRNGILAMRTSGQTEFGVRATPTFVINGQRLEGALPFADFDALLKALLP